MAFIALETVTHGMVSGIYAEDKVTEYGVGEEVLELKVPEIEFLMDGKEEAGRSAVAEVKDEVDGRGSYSPEETEKYCILKEYSGELNAVEDAERCEIKLYKNGFSRDNLASLRNGFVIDASDVGRVALFANHYCN